MRATEKAIGVRPPWTWIAVALACFAATALAWAPSIDWGYLADDFVMVGRAAETPGTLVDRVFGEFLAPEVLSERWRYFRPVWFLFFELDAALADARASHIVLLAVHALSGLLLSRLVHRLTSDTTIALIAGITFVVDPLTTQVVTWISARGDALALAFALLAIDLQLGAGRRSRAARGGAAFCSFLALCSKETGAGAVVALVALDWATRAPGPGRRTAWLRGVAPHGVALALYVALRWHALGELVGGTGIHASLDSSKAAALVGLAGIQAAAILPSSLAGGGPITVTTIGVIGLVVIGVVASRGLGGARPCAALALWWLAAVATVVGFQVWTTDGALVAKRVLYMPAAARTALLAVALGTAARLGRPARVALLVACAGMHAAGRAELVGPFARSAELSAQITGAAREIVTRTPDTPIVLFDLPSQASDGVICMGNAMPGALKPPFTAAEPREPVGVLFRDARTTADTTWGATLLLRPDVLRVGWTAGRAEFVAGGWPHIGSVVRGGVRRRPGGFVLEPHGIPLTGDPERLEDAVGSVVSFDLPPDAGDRLTFRELRIDGFSRVPAVFEFGPAQTLSILAAPGSEIVVLVGTQPARLPLGSIGTLMIGDSATFARTQVPPSGTLPLTIPADSDDLLVQVLLHATTEPRLSEAVSLRRD